jgi:hypothetical protein
MTDILRGLVFSICELGLLVLVFGPLLVGKPRTSTRRAGRAVGVVVFAVIAAAFALTAGIDLVRGHHPAFVANGSPTLTDAVETGQSILLHFHPEACMTVPLGSIQCGSDYHARYDEAAGGWTVSGYSLNNKVDFTTTTRTPLTRGAVNVWGILMEFTDNGSLYYLKQEVGWLAIDQCAVGHPPRASCAHEVQSSIPLAPPAQSKRSLS